MNQSEQHRWHLAYMKRANSLFAPLPTTSQQNVGALLTNVALWNFNPTTKNKLPTENFPAEPPPESVLEPDNRTRVPDDDFKKESGHLRCTQHPIYNLDNC